MLKKIKRILEYGTVFTVFVKGNAYVVKLKETHT